MRSWLLLVGVLIGMAGCQPTPPPSPPPVEVVTVPKPEPPAYENIAIRAQSRRIPVIMYHDAVLERTKDSEWFDVSAQELEDQMKLISDRGMVPISLSDLYQHLLGKKEVPETAIVLTFDDNYQGYYDVALPILRRYNFPSAMFVHTGFVGSVTGKHPKMSWDTLKELVKDPLVTIGSHTISHPDDITLLSPADQTRELTESKAELERQLGVKMDFFAYPDGKNDDAVQVLTKEAGYKMAFSIVNGMAEESPNIFCINRYVHTRLEKALEDRDRILAGGGQGIFEGKVIADPVTYHEEEQGRVKLAIVGGGAPVTVTSETREGVLDFVNRTGAVAGINGTFFSMAAIASTDNKLVGPCKTPEMPEVVPDTETTRWEKLVNRPVVMLGPGKIAIVPYQPASMNNDAVFKNFMPDVTDVFMGGAWLVHNGVAQGREAMQTYASKDAQDARRRAFFGFNSLGHIVVGASKVSCSSADLAEALVAANLSEAVLLDSGFSTSLVYNKKILASGHSTTSSPSRPVPHAIVLKGDLDPASVAVAEAAEPATTTTGGTEPRRRRRRR